MVTQFSVFNAWLTAKLGIKSERGANLVEYVFLLVFIALVVLVAVKLLGTSVKGKFTDASNQLG